MPTLKLTLREKAPPPSVDKPLPVSPAPLRLTILPPKPPKSETNLDKKESPRRLRSRQQIKPPTRYLNETLPSKALPTTRKPKRPAQIRNNLERWKLTDKEKQKITQVTPFDPEETNERVKGFIHQQRAIHIAIDTELDMGRRNVKARRHDAIRIVMALNVLPENQEQRLLDMERNQFIQELQRKYDKVHLQLHERWMASIDYGVSDS